jgi:gluconolactonase
MSKQHFVSYDPSFEDITGGEPTITLCLQNDEYPFAHEAGVFHQSTNEVFITSNQFLDETNKKITKVSKVKVNEDGKLSSEAIPAAVPMANGGINYQDGVLFCAQGTLTEPGGLIYMEAAAPYDTRWLVQDFHGRQFNSPNDVVVHTDGSIWFTDPIYGFEQGIRPKPQLPSQVYRFDPKTQNIRPMVDGFGRPNGICFSPDEKTVYVTDTDWIHGDGTTDDSRASSMCVFDFSRASFGFCVD